MRVLPCPCRRKQFLNAAGQKYMDRGKVERISAECWNRLDTKCHLALEQTLGYLNFSAGAFDSKLYQNLDLIYRHVGQVRGISVDRTDEYAEVSEASWPIVISLLRAKLDAFAGDSGTFSDSDQVRSVMTVVESYVIPGYLEFHRDLLSHQSEELLFGPFMLGRICEMALQVGVGTDEPAKVAEAAIDRLNDYVGHRPVPTLESSKVEPYPHEKTRPIPCYIDGAGVCDGLYCELVTRTLEILENTNKELLREAFFDLSRLEELALDPRAYDFENPANKRPNYHFGQWDPHRIDNQGFYRRFVVQQVTLDALLSRVERTLEIPREQLLNEAAAVLGGTILMASGVCGSGPGTYDSETTLSGLLPRIAAYRDAYYDDILSQFPAEHIDRLKSEAIALHQPFGGARQHLNRELTMRRATQLEKVQLARLFARMGYPQAAEEETYDVATASARMLCHIDCLLTSGRQAQEHGELSAAADILDEIEDYLHRAIECGAIVDPWNIIGFGASFSLFPALENSVHDHRVDELIELVEQIFDLYASVWSEASACDDKPLCDRVSFQFRAMTDWWERFAAHEVPSVGATSSVQVFQASKNVAEALNLWHKGGAESGNIKFWAPHAEVFDSPKSYASVIATLIDRGDMVASMALLVHWLSNAAGIGLESGDASFHDMAVKWLDRVVGIETYSHEVADSRDSETQASSEETWSLTRKFFDFIEANAEEYWTIPEFRLESGHGSSLIEGGDGPGSDGLESDSNGLYEAAYEDVVFRDSTDDGIDDQLFDPNTDSSDEFEAEAERIIDRLSFLATFSRLCRILTLSPSVNVAERADVCSDMRRWHHQARENRLGLTELIAAVGTYRIVAGTTDHDSLVQYDRKRMIKEGLLEQIIAACVETAEAEKLLLAGISFLSRDEPKQDELMSHLDDLGEDEQAAIRLFCHAWSQDVASAREVTKQLIDALQDRPILYVPLAKGGASAEIIDTQIRRRSLESLLIVLPRLGLLTEAQLLIETIRDMEREVPVGPGAVTQFDDLFERGQRAMIQCILRSARGAAGQTAEMAGDMTPGPDEGTRRLLRDTIESELVDCLEKLTESMLIIWLAHSRTLRLSTMEKINSDARWQKVVDFITRYGHDIFTQHFLNLANLRAILHQGVDAWLRRLELDEYEVGWRLLKDLEDDQINRDEAVSCLSVILEAVVENYAEYREYNSTTTQSDRGEMLYTLLDFLRLRTTYDRVSWNLKPVIVSHDVLVRKGHTEAAQVWRRALNERIGEEADRYVESLEELQQKHAMRIAAVADRIGERFMRRLMIDRMRSLVKPAMDHSRAEQAQHGFDILREESALLVRQSTGAGLDAPSWLTALIDEVERVLGRSEEDRDSAMWERSVPEVVLTLDEVRQQLDS